MDPTKANLLAQGVMEFLSKSKNGVVLLDGIESIILNNDFNRSMRMLEQLNDFVMQYRGLLLIPIAPTAFDPRERAVISRNFETIVAGESSFRDMTGDPSASTKFSH
jgi:archaellum biogenesis ATPase FlaH